METMKKDMDTVVEDFIESDHLKKGDVFVLGCSTSEIFGERIGTSGSEQVAAIVFDAVKKLKEKAGIHLAFQCCEHLNRALVVERETMERFQLEEVSVVPVPNAGGSMASYAYKHLEDPVVVEFIRADAGMDIGETLIGMHLKHVAVPFRLSKKFVKNARVTAAYTRPKLIGGRRANYESTRS